MVIVIGDKAGPMKRSSTVSIGGVLMGADIDNLHDFYFLIGHSHMAT
jgi:hypothetical protein